MIFWYSFGNLDLRKRVNWNTKLVCPSEGKS